MAICLKWGSDDLCMVQLMPLPPMVSCFSKIQIGLTFLVPAYPGCPGKRPLNGCLSFWDERALAVSPALIFYSLVSKEHLWRLLAQAVCMLDVISATQPTIISTEGKSRLLTWTRENHPLALSFHCPPLNCWGKGHWFLYATALLPVPWLWYVVLHK